MYKRVTMLTGMQSGTTRPTSDSLGGSRTRQRAASSANEMKTEQQRIDQPLTRTARRSGYRHNLFGRTIAAVVRSTRDGVHLQLVPAPSARDGWPAAGTVQSPFFRGTGVQRKQVGTISVWTETKQIASKALRTLDTMAKPGCHGKY